MGKQVADGRIHAGTHRSTRNPPRVGPAGHHRVLVRALRGITMTLRDGDRLGLVGRNGAGKTTLLRVMTGIYEPVAGRLEVSGRVASLTNTDAWAKAGVMIRASLSAGSTHASMVISSGKGYAFQRRPTTSADSDATDGGAGAPPGSHE